MDYSLLVAVRRLPPEVAKNCGAGPGIIDHTKCLHITYDSVDKYP